MVRNSLKKLRGAQSMADVALKSRISRQMYGMIEAGVRTPSLDVARRIANALDTTIDEAFYGEDGNDALQRAN